MRFLIPINEPDAVNGSVTYHAVETESNCNRTNKKKLREYFIAMGVEPNRVKYVMKQMGFVDPYLGKGAAEKVDQRANREAKHIKKVTGNV